MLAFRQRDLLPHIDALVTSCNTKLTLNECVNSQIFNRCLQSSKNSTGNKLEVDLQHKGQDQWLDGCFGDVKYV